MRWFLIVAWTALAAAAPASFRDCTDCPEMVRIPPGDLALGAAAADAEARPDERPTAVVHIRGFALARAPVTRDDYARFVAATGRQTSVGCAYAGRSWSKMDTISSWSNLGFAQEGNHPVVCVTYADAQAYVDWMSQRTGKRYRLPSEAEWEYAARAGETASYPGGRVIGHDVANFGAPKCCKEMAEGADRWLYTAPVDAFPANGFGVRDMLGNALEWVSDCYRPGYAGQPRNGRPFTTDVAFDAGQGKTLRSCDLRGLRGGDWGNPPAFLRFSARNYGPAPGYSLADYRSGGVGFRIARDR